MIDTALQMSLSTVENLRNNSHCSRSHTINLDRPPSLCSTGSWTEDESGKLSSKRIRLLRNGIKGEGQVKGIVEVSIVVAASLIFAQFSTPMTNSLLKCLLFPKLGICIVASHVTTQFI